MFLPKHPRLIKKILQVFSEDLLQFSCSSLISSADHTTLVPTVEEAICKEFVSSDVTEPIDEAGECQQFITSAGCTPDVCRPQCIQRCNGRGTCAPVGGGSTCGCLCTCPCQLCIRLRNFLMSHFYCPVSSSQIMEK